MNYSRNYAHRLLEYGYFILRAESGNLWGIGEKEKQAVRTLRIAYRKSTKKIFTSAEHIYVTCILTNSFPTFKSVEEQLLDAQRIHSKQPVLPEDSEDYEKVLAVKNLMRAIVRDIKALPELGFLQNPKKWQEAPLIHTKPSNAFIRVIAKALFDFIDTQQGALEKIDTLVGIDTTIYSERDNEFIEDSIMESEHGQSLLQDLDNITEFMAQHQVRSLKRIDDNELALEFITFHFTRHPGGIIAVIPDYLREQRLYRTFPFKALEHLMSQHFRNEVFLGWSEFNRRRKIDEPLLKKCLLAGIEQDSGISKYHSYCRTVNKKYSKLMSGSDKQYEKVLSKSDDDQNVSETLEKRLLQNGIKLESSIKNKSSNQIRALVYKKNIDHIICPSIHTLVLEDLLDVTNKLPIIHVSRTGKSWEEVLEPGEKKRYHLPSIPDELYEM